MPDYPEKEKYLLMDKQQTFRITELFIAYTNMFMKHI